MISVATTNPFVEKCTLYVKGFLPVRNVISQSRIELLDNFPLSSKFSVEIYSVTGSYWINLIRN